MVGTWEDKCHITHRETEARRDGDEGWNHNVLPVRTNHKHIPAPCRALLQTSRGCCPQAGLTQSSSISQHSGEGGGKQPAVLTQAAGRRWEHAGISTAGG